jgi:hypothetical protein
VSFGMKRIRRKHTIKVDFKVTVSEGGIYLKGPRGSVVEALC